MTRYCERCGSPIRTGIKYCYRCRHLARAERLEGIKAENKADRRKQQDRKLLISLIGFYAFLLIMSLGLSVSMGHYEVFITVLGMGIAIAIPLFIIVTIKKSILKRREINENGQSNL